MLELVPFFFPMHFILWKFSFLIKLLCQMCLNIAALVNGVPLGVVVDAGFGCHNGSRTAQIISFMGYLNEGLLVCQVSG